MKRKEHIIKNETRKDTGNMVKLNTTKSDSQNGDQEKTILESDRFKYKSMINQTESVLINRQSEIK